MATYSKILAWEIPWTESLVGYGPWGHKRVGHNLVTEQSDSRACAGADFRQNPTPFYVRKRDIL